tara:strand:- start:960 stop:2135 length:1176 start_codon:yes stop_codon:yes gene_type:complete
MYQINIISISILFFLISIILFLAFVEIRVHINSLKKIPIRIHVNGIRGKSSVVRLIAAGLRESGLRTFAKTTGTIPRIINEKGKDVELHRLRSASIGEQIKLMRYFANQSPDALVIECMAVNPQYQWISEHRIVRSTLGVITNVRRDHLDEMGTTILDIAKSISNTIPFNSKIISSKNKFYDLFKRIANKRNSDIDVSDISSIKKDYMDKFPYIEHPENIALALKVCNSLGIDDKTALKGMLKTTPDPGVLFIWDILKDNNKNQFISAFAANDPDSTIKVWKLVKDKSKNKKCIFLNTRDDRRYRTIQLIDLVYENIKPDLFIVRGNNVSSLMKKYHNDKIELKLFDMSSSQNDVVNYMINLNGYFIMGIGNIVGWGDNFLNHLKKYKVNG